MITVRFAVFEDASAIASLATSLGYETTAEEMRLRLQRIFVHRDYVSLVAENDGAVVGFLGLAFGLYYERTGSYARITMLSVAPEARGQGVGGVLVAAAERTARERDALTMIVSSGIRRAAAHRFYERCGFAGTAKTFYKSLAVSESVSG